MAQFSGTVRWFDNTKGYGFLGHEQGQDVFVHFSALQTDDYRGLHDGEPVELGTLEEKKGSPTDNTRPIDRTDRKQRHRRSKLSQLK
jgi:CspA family cold shock protein